jgi:hypothetical protein
MVYFLRLGLSRLLRPGISDADKLRTLRGAVAFLSARKMEAMMGRGRPAVLGRRWLLHLCGGIPES